MGLSTCAPGRFISSLRALDSWGAHSSGALKKETNVMWGVKLCAPFHPHNSLDWAQKFSNCWRNGPVGHAYRIYSRGEHSSSDGSFTCANNQSDANCTPRFPVAARAFSLQERCHRLNIRNYASYIKLTLYVSEIPSEEESAEEWDAASRFLLA